MVQTSPSISEVHQPYMGGGYNLTSYIIHILMLFYSLEMPLNSVTRIPIYQHHRMTWKDYDKWHMVQTSPSISEVHQPYMGGGYNLTSYIIHILMLFYSLEMPLNSVTRDTYTQCKPRARAFSRCGLVCMEVAVRTRLEIIMRE